jgi:aryl-alcohol dehydrogenase-like predicted oxidoreductase
MKQRRLGTTGLYVSHLALGTMSWGHDTDEDDASNQLTAFLEAGGNLVDTADVYIDGESERVLGRLLAGVVKRDDVVVATKAASVRGGDRDRDASRRHILGALDASLARLGTDYVDVWQMHAWDPRTPLEETLAALDVAVSSGRARYVGISNYTGWQTAKAAAWQRAWPGRAPIVATQVEYSLLQRGIEREVVPAALNLGIGILPWSPLGRGVLTGKYQTETPAGSRGATADYTRFITPYLDERASRIVGSVLTAADGLGVSPLAVALAWVRDRPGVVAPIVGARTAGQLKGSLEADATVLPDEIRRALDDVSMPDMGYPEGGMVVSP